MRAYTFHKKGPIAQVLHLETVPTPTPDSSSESLVHITASAINPSDSKNVTGFFDKTVPPRIPGRDFAGVVQGGEFDGLRVWGTGGVSGFTRDGTHAEYIVVPNRDLCARPENISDAQAAGCGVAYLTAQAMISRAGIKAGDYVLIIGSSGSVGSAAVQLCKRLKAIPLESSRVDKENAVNVSKDDLAEQIQALTNGASVNVVLDTVSEPVIFQKALSILKRYGTYAIITAPRTTNRKLYFDALSLYREDRSLVGVNSLNISFEESMNIFRGLKEGFESGDLKPPQSIMEVDFENEAEVIKAYEAVFAGAKSKYVLIEKGTR